MDNAHDTTNYTESISVGLERMATRLGAFRKAGYISKD